MFRFRYQASRLFNLMTIVILSLLCVLLNYLTRIDFHHLELPKNKPEFASAGLNLNLYAKTGKLLYAITAQSGVQYPDDNKIHLNILELRSFSESDGLLLNKITSNDGWIDGTTSNGYLGESVVLMVNSENKKEIAYAYSKHVHLNAKQQYIYGSEPIRIIRGKSIMTGVGFNIDYTRQILTIESQVKIIYAK